MIKNKLKTKQRSIDDIELGNHICSIYQSKEQQFALIVPFFKAGLERNEKCIYIADENTNEDIIAEFVKRGVDIDKYIKSNKFVIISKQQSYLRGGSFDPDQMIQFIKESEEGALKQGYSGMRFSGEMTWILSNISDIDKLIIYESKLTDFFLHSKSSAICQYNENKFKPDVLTEVLNTHPLAIIYGNLFENPYYSSISRIKKAANIPMDPIEYSRLRDSIINGN